MNAERLAPSKVLAAAADGLVDMIGRKGGSADAVFCCANVRVRDISSPTNELNLFDYCELFEEAARQTRDPNFGLQFGAQFQPKKLGPIGYAAITSPTLGAALRNMEIYFPAHQESSSFGLIEDGSVLWLSYQITDPRITRRRQDAELSLGMFCNVFRHALGEDWSPLEARFEHNQMEARAHSHYFGAPVQFGHRINAIAFTRDVLSTPMPERDPYLFMIIEAMLKSRCALQGSPQDLVSVLRTQIKMNLGEPLRYRPDSRAEPRPAATSAPGYRTDLQRRAAVGARGAGSPLPENQRYAPDRSGALPRLFRTIGVFAGLPELDWDQPPSLPQVGRRSPGLNIERYVASYVGPRVGSGLRRGWKREPRSLSNQFDQIGFRQLRRSFREGGGELPCCFDFAVRADPGEKRHAAEHDEGVNLTLVRIRKVTLCPITLDPGVFEFWDLRMVLHKRYAGSEIIEEPTEAAVVEID